MCLLLTQDLVAALAAWSGSTSRTSMAFKVIIVLASRTAYQPLNLFHRLRFRFSRIHSFLTFPKLTEFLDLESRR